MYVPLPLPVPLASPELTLCVDSVLFLIFSLTFIATVLYLPHHLQFIISRAWFYMHGDAQDAGASAVVQTVSSTLGKVAQATAGGVVREL